MFVYGGSFCRLWVNQEFGDQAAILLPILLIGYTLSMSQFISAAVLMGIARYQSYSISCWWRPCLSSSPCPAVASLWPHRRCHWHLPP